MATAVIQMEYGEKALENRIVYSATRNFEDVIPMKIYKINTDFAQDTNADAVPTDREGIAE